jgi:hypothetical protein
MWSVVLNGLGLIGNVAFGIACVPTAYKTVKVGKSIGTPVSLAWTLATACTCFYIYMVGTYGWNPMVWCVGLIETICYIIVLKYHYFPRS